nr:MAG TPA: hypothetical protein [Caudoviricetes sp.]DAL75394.1 MAG TPA: hypothetical protein [Bacteriophage sp.]
MPFAFSCQARLKGQGRTAYFGVRIPGYHFGQNKILKGST